MRDNPGFDGNVLFTYVPMRRTQPRLILFAALLTALTSAAICSAAILDRAPAAAVPLIVIVCLGCPLFAAWNAPAAWALVRADRRGGKALIRLQRTLAQLPETEHPLGL